MAVGADSGKGLTWSFHHIMDEVTLVVSECPPCVFPYLSASVTASVVCVCAVPRRATDAVEAVWPSYHIQVDLSLPP